MKKRKKFFRGPSTINKRLAEVQGISEEDQRKISRLHKKRKNIENKMQETDSSDIDKLLKLFKDWTNNEFALQRLWNFKEDSNWHMSFSLPCCCCPYLDNIDSLGTNIKYNNPDCIYHGSKWKDKRLKIIGVD